jgi:hypothetical protein
VEAWRQQVVANPFDIDRLVARAIAEAAEALAMPGAQLREKDLEAALVRSLPNHVEGTPIPHKGPFKLPDWDPKPGPVDIRIVNAAAETFVAAELKVEKTDETLWDIVKMLAAARCPHVQRTYVVVAASSKTWNGKRECADLFFTPAEPPQKIRSARLFDRYWRSWTHLLLEGSARPTRMPDLFHIHPVAAVRNPNMPDWEIRAISVRPVAGRILPFQDGWPIGMQPGPDDT